MLICDRHADLGLNTSSHEVDWRLSGQSYPNLQEMPSFIAQQRQLGVQRVFTTNADPQLLQGKQMLVYTAVRQHFEAHSPQPPLRMIVSGTAGTGKSYIINCLRLLLKEEVFVAAPTGVHVAAFNVEGHTLHSLFCLPTKSEYKDLEGEQLLRLQKSLEKMSYLIIDEMSMVGRKVFGQLDRRLRQVFPHKACEILGGCSCILFGDFGQLPPVMDLPLYTSSSRAELSDLGRTAYQMFDQAIVLDQIIRQAGQDPAQVLFRDILLRLRDAQVSTEDWEVLMNHTPAHIEDLSPFSSSNTVHLHPTVEAVVKYNVAQLEANGEPVATIKAVHTGPGASKAPSDNAAGLEPVLCLAKKARVMLTSNIWVDMGLVNGAMGVVEAICYINGSPPDLPVAVMIRFDTYSGPCLPDGTVPIAPIRRTWSNAGVQCSRLQLPLKLAWAITIHKAQGLTLNKVVIDVGKKEFCAGLTFVACSRVRSLSDLLFNPPFPYQRLANLSKSQRLKERQLARM